MPTNTFFQGFPNLKLHAIRDQIGEGANHLVYQYLDSQVIKVPKRLGPFSYSSSHLLTQDLELIQKYFPELAVETTIVRSEDQTRYCIIQQLFRGGEEISSDTIHLVRDQIEKIVAQNKKLFADTGYALDLFGSAGFKNSLLGLVIPGYKPSLSNIFMRREKDSYKVYLLDTELLRLRTAGECWKSIPQWVQARVSYFLTSFLLNSVFKLRYS